MYIKTKYARNYAYLHINKISTPPNNFWKKIKSHSTSYTYNIN